MTSEISAWLEHELLPGFAIQGGYVYRGIDNFRVLANANRPMSAYNVPITIRDPGPDGVLGNADDGAGIPGFNLSAAAIAAGVRNLTTNLPGSAEYHTVEFSATKRQSGRWSLQGSFAMRWNEDQETAYFGNNLRSLTTPSTPNDLINTVGRPLRIHDVDGEGQRQLRRAVGHPPHAGAAGAAGPAVRPDVPGRCRQRHQLRHRSASSPSRSTRSGRTPSAFSTSAPRSRSAWGRGASRSSATSTTSPTRTPPRTSPGTAAASYLRPVSIIGPRIMRFGTKFDW